MKRNKSRKNKRYIIPLKKLSLSSSYKRNLSMMKLLISHNEFQKDIRDMREHLNIPIEGFREADNDKDVKQWYENLELASDKVLESRKFAEQEIKIRKKLSDREITHSMARKHMGLLYEKVPTQYLHNTGRFIVFKFKLPLHFEDYIKKYIVSSRIDAPQRNYGGGMHPAFTDFKNDRYLPIKIYTKLTKDEIQELQAYINWAGPRLPKYNFIKDIDHKLTMEKWYEENRDMETEDMVGGKKRRVSLSEMAREMGKTGKQVYDTVRSVRKTRNKILGHSENSGT